MRVISSIEDPAVIRVILEHLGLWLARARPPPKIHDPPVRLLSTGRPAAPSISDDVSQIPVHDDHFYGDPQYSWDDYWASRPRSEPIAQKGLPPIHIPYKTLSSPLIFDGKYP
jgi:hypothetical protein